MADFTKHGIAVPPLQPSWMQRGFVAEPDIAGVVNALVKTNAGLPEGSAAAAQHWIEKEMSAEAVSGHFHRLIQDGMRKPPPRPEISGEEDAPRPSMTRATHATRATASKRRSARTKGPTTREQGGDETPKVLHHEPTVLHYEEWSAETWVKPATAFVLLMSNKLVLRRSELHKVLQMPALQHGQETELAFLVSERLDGTRFPLREDASMGRVERDTTILLRTSALAKAVESAQASGGGGQMELFDVVYKGLQTGRITSIVHIDNVVARHTHSGDKSEL